ncbi:MAG TPA: hypothetical protein VIH61_06865 [Waddliaceae bacterium]
MKLIHSILFLMCCFTAVAYGTESVRCDQMNCEESSITRPEACPVSDDCPRDSHPIGTPCPHDPT